MLIRSGGFGRHMTALDNRLVMLVDGRARCAVAPGAGGAAAGFWWESEGRRTDWLRPASATAVAQGNAREMGCFPMVPYGSRIRGGRFLFCGREVVESSAGPDMRHALHGHGWRRDWTVIERHDRRVVLEYAHEPGAWPWRYRARQCFALADEALTISLEIENLSDGLMPAGLGFQRSTPPSIVRSMGWFGAFAVKLHVALQGPQTPFASFARTCQ